MFFINADKTKSQVEVNGFQQITRLPSVGSSEFSIFHSLTILGAMV